MFTLFALSYFGTWFGFAAIWYWIGYAHGDFTLDPETGLPMTEGPRACLVGVNSFVDCILMSVETQVRHACFLYRKVELTCGKNTDT